MQEFELKFQVPELAVAPLERELRSRGARASRFVAQYFDTPDKLLAAHGVALRLRKEGRRWVQTLKASGESAVQRLEHNVALRPAPGALPALDVARHDGTPAGERLRQALAQARDARLVEQYRVDVKRLAVTLRWPDAEVEAALDTGAIHAGGAETAVCELELEHLAGGTARLFELARLWGHAGGLWLDVRSKAHRGTLLAAGTQLGPPVRAGAVPLTPVMDGDTLVRAVVRAVLAQVLGNASEVAAGVAGPDHVHQLRVGLRRLRTALRELGPLAGGIEPAWEPTLAETFGRLGELRDDEAVAAAVHDLLVDAKAPKLRWAVPARTVDAATLVRDPQFQATLLDLLQWALGEPGPEGQATSADKARAQVAARLDALHKQVVKAGRSFDTLTTDQQHRARKRLKRLRYLAEFVAPLWSAKHTRRYIKRLNPMQDALGHHNDVVVAEAKFTTDGQRDPQALFAAGFLKAHQAVTARAAQRALEALAGAPRFWKPGR